MKYNFPIGSEEDMVKLIKLATVFFPGPHIDFSKIPQPQLDAYHEFIKLLYKYKVKE